MIPTSRVYISYIETSGQPLEAGYIYIGIAGQNPETSPLPIYFDYAATQPAAQPLRTTSGCVVRGGTPTNVFVASNYSITIRNSNHALVYTTLDAAASGDMFAILIGPTGSSQIGFIRAESNAVATTVQTELRRGPYMPEQFGAKETYDASVNDTSYVQRCNDAGQAVVKAVKWSREYSTTAITFGECLTGSVASASPPALFADEQKTVGLIARPGTTGALFNATNLTGVTIGNVVFDGNNESGVTWTHDFSWGSAGPDTQNRFFNIYGQNYAQGCGNFENNNQSTIKGCVWRSPSPYHLTGSIAVAVLTVTAVIGTPLAVGQYITDPAGSAVTAFSRIISLGTGTGGIGTYNLSQSSTVTSRALTATPDNRVAVNIQGASGQVMLEDCSSFGGIMDIACQNARLTGCQGSGIRLNHSQIGSNNIDFTETYIYSNSVGSCIWDEQPAIPGRWSRGMTFSQANFIPTVANDAIFNFGLGGCIIGDGITVESAVAWKLFGSAMHNSAGAGSQSQCSFYITDTNNNGDFTPPTGIGVTYHMKDAGGQVLGDFGPSTWTITDQSGAGLSLTVANPKTIRVGGQLCWACADVTYPATADVSNAAISLPTDSLAGTVGTGVVGFTDYGALITVAFGGVGSTNKLNLYTAAGVPLTNANLSGKRLIVSVQYITTV